MTRRRRGVIICYRVLVTMTVWNTTGNKSTHHSKSAGLCKAYPVQIRSPHLDDPVSGSGSDSELDDFQNLTKTFFSKDTSEIKFSWRFDHFFERYEPNIVEKCPIISQCWRICKKNSTCGFRCEWLPKFNQFSLSTDVSLVKFFLED